MTPTVPYNRRKTNSHTVIQTRGVALQQPRGRWQLARDRTTRLTRTIPSRYLLFAYTLNHQQQVVAASKLTGQQQKHDLLPPTIAPEHKQTPTTVANSNPSSATHVNSDQTRDNTEAQDNELSNASTKHPTTQQEIGTQNLDHEQSPQRPKLRSNRTQIKYNQDPQCPHNENTPATAQHPCSTNGTL
ncbi:hypothetical protein V6Z11_D01G224700 [Gossypium hirsutum]